MFFDLLYPFAMTLSSTVSFLVYCILSRVSRYTIVGSEAKVYYGKDHDYLFDFSIIFSGSYLHLVVINPQIK